MADYDLGTAHGRIVVDYDDKGSAQAESRFDRLKVAAASLRASLDNAEASFKKNSSSISDYGQKINDTTNKLASHIRILDQVTKAGKALTDSNTGTARTFGTVAGSLLGVRRELNGASLGTRTLERSLNSTTSAFSVASSLTRTLGTRLFGLRANTNSLPEVFQRVIRLSAGIALFRASSGIILSFANRFGAFRGATAILERLGLHVGLLATRLFPQLGGIGGEALRRLVSGFAGIEGGIRAFATLGFAIANGIGAFRGFLNIAKLFGTAMKFASIGASALGVAAAALTTTVHLAGVALNFLGTVANGAAVAVNGVLQATVQMSGAALLIPGVLGAAGLAFGTLKIGMSGFSKALKQVGADQATFDKAIKKLAPPAQELLREIRAFAPAFKDMQINIQTKLFAGFGAELKQLGGTYMPILYKGTEQVAIGLNKVATGFLKLVGQEQTQKDTARAFELTAVVLGNLSKVIAPLGEALRDVAITGLEVFTHMTGGIEGAAIKLRDFVATARRTGELRKFIEDGVQGFKDLGVILKNLGVITAQVFRQMGGDASTGGNVLAHVRAITDSWVQTTKHIDLAGTKLGKVIDGVRIFYGYVQRVSDVWVTTLTAAFNALLPVIIELSPYMRDLSLTIGQVLTSAIRTLAPVVLAVAKVFTFFGSALIPLIAPIVAVGVAFKALGLAMLVLRPIVQGLAAVFGIFKFFKGAAVSVEALSNAFRGVGIASGPIGAVANAFGSLVTRIQLGAMSITGLFSRMIGSVTSFARGFADGFNGAATSANGFAAKLGAGLNTAQAVVRTAMSGIVSGVSSAAGAVASAAGSVGRGVSSGFMAGANAAANAATSIALRLANGIASGAGAVSNAATSLAGRIAPAVIGAGAAVANAAQNVSGRIAVGISQAAASVGGATGNVMNTVALGVASAGNAVANAATRVAGGIANGILAAGGAVSSAATRIGANVAIGLTNATGGVIGAATRLGGGIASGISSASGAVGSAMGRIGGLITGALSGMGNAASSAASGIGRAISGTVGAFASMAGAITISSRAASAAITTAFGVGIVGILVAAIALFINMSDSQKQVRATAEALKTENDALADSQAAVTRAFVASKGVINGDIYSGLNTQIDAVRTSLDSVGKAGVSNFESAKIQLSHLGDFMGTLTNKYGEQVDAQRKVAEVNAQAKSSIDSLGLSTAQLGQIVGGAQAEFDQLQGKLRGMGEGGTLAADKLAAVRDKMLEAQRSAVLLTPGMSDLAAVIHKLAEGTGTAADKANLLKQAFDALHGKQASVAEANASYNKSLLDVAEKSGEAADRTKGYGDALVSANGSVNSATANGNALYSSLGTIVTGYQTAASAAYDASFAQTHNAETAQAASQAVYDKLTPALQQLGAQYGLTEAQVREMAAQMGAVPKEVNSQLAVQGGDVAKEAILQVQLALNTVPVGKNVVITAPSDAAIAQLTAVGINVEKIPGTKDVKVTAPTQTALDQLNLIDQSVDATGAKVAVPKVGLDPHQFQNENAAVLDDLGRTHGSRADPKVGMDPHQFQNENAGVLDALGRTNASQAVPQVGLNASVFNNSNDQVHQLLGVLSRSTADPQARLILDQFNQGKNFTIGSLNDLSNRIANPAVRAEVQSALNNIQTVQNYLGSLQDKTVTLTTVQRNQVFNDAVQQGIATNRGQMAEGGIIGGYADGGIEHFASGGMHRLNPMSSKTASIVGPNTWRVIGDRVKDDEFYIPDTNQPQHMAIGAEWARRRGLALVKMFAEGGYASAAARLSGGAATQVNSALQSSVAGQSAARSASQVQSAAQAALIGQLVLQVPQGVTAQQQAEEVMFAVRRAGKGVYA